MDPIDIDLCLLEEVSLGVLSGLGRRHEGEKSSEDGPLLPASSAVALEDMARIVIGGGESYEVKDGVCRARDGGLFVVCTTPMNFSDPGKWMTYWLSCFCDDTPRYRVWHPFDHKKGTWSRDYLSVPMEERSSDHCIGKTHLVEECVGGNLERVRINFRDPAEHGMDAEILQAAGITACFVGRISVSDFLAGDVSVGWLCHSVRETESNGAELKSYFWLGDIHKHGTSVRSRIVNWLGRYSWLKRLRGPIRTAHGIYRHCREEMACLSAILEVLSRSSAKKEESRAPST